MMKNRNPSTRRATIQRQLRLDGTVSVESLARELDVSVATIRRDLTLLNDEGSIQRTHGGAIATVTRGADQAFALREQIDRDGKRLIARDAIELIEPNQTLFMNDGSTLLALARDLVASGMTLTVATPGINIATALSENPGISTYLAGGLVRHKTLGTTGDFVEHMLSTINADIAFLATEGLSVDEGLTYSYEADAKIARIMQEKATRTVVLATARKLGQRDRMTAFPASEIDVLVTDCRNDSQVQVFRNLGISVVVATATEYINSNIQGDAGINACTQVKPK
ncbi:DeoR/GlpR family DNA-binding transcription regulator [Candidatus Spongiihabitans sp.]|uniref:DeoR/GlpR family DNA-binding transcription regulator n=1 Tax=Candidatus Spongiihabitans sp. TaxID=3101308 RepID=UPI003C7EC924